MEQAFGKFLMFKNRLEKMYRHLGRQARRQGIGCFRVYDHDLPDFPFLIELYEDKVYVSEYKRNHMLSEEAHEDWLEASKKIISEVFGLDPSAIYLKLRQRKAGRQGQYQKLDQQRNEFTVHEQGLQFLVNLSDYLDTGLFLDHRITRQMVREQSAGKKMLNLFCYTGSFSVYAVAGGASGVVSVDLSRTYLDWADRNMKLNFPEYGQHEMVHADVKQYVKDLKEESVDLIVMDPPTFSNSKRMDDFLDIQRDHVELINGCLQSLTPNGVIFFSTNFTRFKMDNENINTAVIRDITRQTTPFDFEGKLKRQCFRIEK